MATMDHDVLARELVRAVRAHRSQRQLSRWLGYTTNVVYGWESGRRYPSAERFFRLLQRTGTVLPEALAGFYRDPPAWLADDPGSAAWVQRLLADLRGHTSLIELSERTGISRHALSRWCRGSAQPRLPDLLRFVEGASGRLLAFVERIVDPMQLPSVASAFDRLQRARDLAWASPWAQVVMLALELASYRATPAHSDRWLAELLGLAEDEVADCVGRLRAAGQVVSEGSHLRPAEVLHVNLRGPRTGPSLKQTWARVAAQRAAVDGAMVSYNLFTISEVDLQVLRDMQRAHYKAVRALVAGSEAAERVVLMNIHTIPLDRPVARSDGD